jgi:hypothetical protein
MKSVLSFAASLLFCVPLFAREARPRAQAVPRHNPAHGPPPSPRTQAQPREARAQELAYNVRLGTYCHATYLGPG